MGQIRYLAHRISRRGAEALSQIGLKLNKSTVITCAPPPVSLKGSG